MIKALLALIVVTAQLLDYERGLIFFTSGDAFRVSPAVRIENGPPAPRKYARVTFDENGIVTRIEVSAAKLPVEGAVSDVHRWAVTQSTPAPNPDLSPPKASDACANTVAGRLVTISITVLTPPTTVLRDSVYMTSDQSGWNPQAYRLDRIDALHYRTLLQLYSGTQMRVLFDRGSIQSVEVGQNGIEETPHLLCIGAENAQAFTRTVYHWADEQSGTQLQVPQTMPTPYNPAPFPNLPTPHPASAQR